MAGLNDLLTAAAVRDRCHYIGNLAEAGEARHFTFHPEQLDHCIARVVEECHANYPALDIPLHSRWRHFVVDGVDLWACYQRQRLQDLSNISVARIAIDLVFLSVILDAGAGPDWRYRDPVTTRVLQRSEGLAAASIDLFFNHLCNGDTAPRLRAEGIRRLSQSAFSDAYQSNHNNLLLGVQGRLALLQALADQLDMLKIEGPGDIIDLFLDGSEPVVSAGALLEQVLAWFNPIWPSGLVVDGVSLGDCGRHALIETGDETAGIIPFHKLSQWLTWSLIEPLDSAGIEVSDLDQLTGLPEYRNGGLLLDAGVLRPKHADLLSESWPVDSELVVEWRALTVWLLDRIAAGVRDQLGMDDQALPLGSVLQGGTWSAGRRLANERRGGEPPIRLAIDGTVF